MAACAGYHETQSTRAAISGVCFAPRSRDQLLGSLTVKGNEARATRDGRVSGERRGTLHCYRFTQHAYLTPAFSTSPRIPCTFLPRR